MPTTEISYLAATLAELAGKVGRYRGRHISEQDTKNALISVLLKSLGWDVHDLDSVTHEWRPTSFRGNPVDYALLSEDGHTPIALVEAKALSEKLDKHAKQAASYAQLAGVKWAILTNGEEWRVFRAGGMRPDTPLPDWAVFQCSVGDIGAADLLGRLAVSELRSGTFETWVRARHDRRALGLAVARLLAEPDPRLTGVFAEESGLPPSRVRELWLSVRAENGWPSFSHMALPGETATLGLPNAEESPGPSSPVAVLAPSAVASTATALPVPAEPWCPSSQPPTAGTKPLSVRVFGTVFAAHSWANLLRTVVLSVAARDPARFASALDDDSFLARKSRRLGRHSSGMRKAAEVPGGFLEVNLDCADCVALARQILKFVCGELSEFDYRVSDSGAA